MSDTQLLLSRIAALRQRLDQAQGIAGPGGPNSDLGLQARSASEGSPIACASGSSVEALQSTVEAGARQQALVEGALRRFPETLDGPTDRFLPGRLTARASRLLKRCQELLTDLRALSNEALLQDETEPLTRLYHETALMTDMALRTVQAFPESASVQLRLCEGLGVILAVVAERLAAIRAGLEQRQEENDCLLTVAGLLVALAAGQAMDVKPWTNVAERVLAQAHHDVPLHIRYEPPENPVRFVAGHSLTVAQIVARIIRHEPDWRNRPLAPVMAALVHDVGMLCVPREILCHAGPLDDAQRRAVEVHANAGAELLSHGLADAGALVEAAAYHHERLDGTGYPAGLRDMQIAPLVRLLSACDVYAALCAPRPHRLAFDTRTALTDTLLLAEQGALDRHQAELLLKLSFYPPGTLVELADGSVGLVVATHQGRRDLTTPARPVVAVLTDAQGQALAAPRHVDLAACEGRSIVRSLPDSERRRVLAGRYPELV
jgi:HD-GYP domain-containing protein (c-di-GMP phosphodiesterase class II)